MSRASPCVVVYFIFFLLTLWWPGETRELCPHDETLTILALVPCYNPPNVSGISTSTIDGSSQCNYLAYSAARLAAEHWNAHSSVANITVQIKAPKGHKVINVDTVLHLNNPMITCIYFCMTYVRTLTGSRIVSYPNMQNFMLHFFLLCTLLCRGLSG